MPKLLSTLAAGYFGGEDKRSPKRVKGSGGPTGQLAGREMSFKSGLNGQMYFETASPASFYRENNI